MSTTIDTSVALAIHERLLREGHSGLDPVSLELWRALAQEQCELYDLVEDITENVTTPTETPHDENATTPHQDLPTELPLTLGRNQRFRDTLANDARALSAADVELLHTFDWSLTPARRAFLMGMQAVTRRTRLAQELYTLYENTGLHPLHVLDMLRATE